MPKVIMYKWTDEMDNVILSYCIKNALNIGDFIRTLGCEDNWYRMKKKGMSILMFRKICGLVPEFKDVTLLHE